MQLNFSPSKKISSIFFHLFTRKMYPSNNIKVCRLQKKIKTIFLSSSTKFFRQTNNFSAQTQSRARKIGAKTSSSWAKLGLFTTLATFYTTRHIRSYSHTDRTATTMPRFTLQNSRSFVTHRPSSGHALKTTKLWPFRDGDGFNGAIFSISSTRLS